MSFTRSQPPDDASGRRYSGAFPYVFALLDPGADDPTNTAKLVTDGRFITLVLPQQISMREPFATSVTAMQDGGKVIESSGQLIRMASVSGTTGFLPPSPASLTGAIKPPQGALVADVSNIDDLLGQISGYLAFRKLRHLFRTYGDERRAGNIRIQMHFFDYKTDDFWRIEPETFDMLRSSRKPMSYDYNIAFKCIEYSDNQPPSVTPTLLAYASFSAVRTQLKDIISYGNTALPPQSVLQTVSRLSDKVTSALDFVKYCDVVVQRAFQLVIRKMNAVVEFFKNIRDTFFAQLDLVLSLLRDLTAELDFLSATAEEFAPANINFEINEWYLEATSLIDHMSQQIGIQNASQPQRDVSTTDLRFSQGRMKQGATTDLMREPTGSPGAPDANPFIGSSGLGLVTNPTTLASNPRQFSVVINHGEDIYGLARRVLGDINRFMDLVLINQLEFPFIVADKTRKPPNTLAWGDICFVPSDATGAGSALASSADPQAVPTTAGTVTDPSLPSQLIDTEQEWLPDQWVGYTVTVTTGLDVQSLIAIGNTSDGTITFNGNLTIPITPDVSTYTVTYVRFDPRRPVNPQERAYGRDVLVVFDEDGRGDAVIGARNDLAQVSGLDNFFQAITLRSRCPVGQHPFHPPYGFPAPVGRPGTADVAALSLFFMRRSILSDPRVGKVRNLKLSQVGDTMMLDGEVQPVDSRTAQPISLRVGS